MLTEANVRGLLAGLGLAAGLVVIGSSCHQSIMTAPPGSTFSLFANPGFIPANGGVSIITAVVYDGTGQPVPDGTVIQFFTTLGRIDEQARTNDGVAKANLVADGRSGTAKVFAQSGGGSIPGTAPTVTASGSPPPSAGGGGGVNGAGPIDVEIGTVLPKSILLTAEPRNIASDAPRYTTLTASVFDASGNPIKNVPVVFSIVTDNDFSESLESGGRPVYTDNNGQAHDRLWTSVARDAGAQPVVVQAQVAVGSTPLASNSLSIGINY